MLLPLFADAVVVVRVRPWPVFVDPLKFAARFTAAALAVPANVAVEDSALYDPLEADHDWVIRPAKEFVALASTW
jgi:hypothetical protein